MVSQGDISGAVPVQVQDTSITMYPEPVPVVTGIESLGYPLVTFVRPFKVFLHVRFYKEHDFKGFVASAFRYRHVNFTILDNPSAYIEPQVFICVGIVKLNLRKYPQRAFE